MVELADTRDLKSLDFRSHTGSSPVCATKKMSEIRISAKTKGVLPLQDQNLENKILVLNPELLKAEYRRPEFQLVKATGGFGCSPTAIGTAVFVKWLIDGDKTRWERYHFIGIASPELIKQILPHYEE